MSPAAADVGLELRRIGGIDGAFNLLRRRAVRESDDVYAGRIELGVALLACKIGLGLCEAHTQRGTIKTPSSSQVDGQDCQQRQRQVDSSSVVEALLPTWGAKALVVVLETLLRGGCSSNARVILLKVVAALGSHAPEAGVAPQLFVMLSDGIAAEDAQCCRYVSQALALCLNQSRERATVSAHDEKLVPSLLALACPGRIRFPRPPRTCVVAAAATTLRPDRAAAAGPKEHCCRTVSSIRDDKTRENALSCLCSIVKADASAAKNIHAAGGLRPLFVLAMGEEPVLCDKPGQRRPRTSLVGPPASSTRKSSSPSASVSASGASGRPMTAGAPTMMVKRSSLDLDKTANDASVPAPIADSTICSTGGSNRGGSNRGGGGTTSRGANASVHSVPGAVSNFVTVPGEETTPFPPPLLREGGTRAGGGGNDDEARSDLSAESLKGLPRVPPVDSVQGGVGTPRPDERMAVLATAILVACLRGDERRTTATGRPDPRDEQPAIAPRSLTLSGEEGDGVHTAMRGEAAVAAAIAPASVAVAVMPPYREKVGSPPPPPPPPPPPTLLSRRRSRDSRRFTQGANASAEGDSDVDNAKPPPRRARRKRRSLSWRRGRQTTATAATATAVATAARKRETPRAAQVFFSLGESTPPLRDQVDSGSNQAEGRSACLLSGAAGDGKSSSSTTALQRLRRDRRGGASTAEFFSELERLSAVSRVPKMLSAPSPLLQELGVVILERGIEDTEKDEARTLRRTSVLSPTKRKRKRQQQQQALRSVIAGSGTALRSLCWLLLHRRRDVSEGAAAVLLALTTFSASSGSRNRESCNDGGTDTGATTAAPAWVILGLVEQGCVPILRMAAGYRQLAVLPSPLPPREGVRVPVDAAAAAGATGTEKQGSQRSRSLVYASPSASVAVGATGDEGVTATAKEGAALAPAAADYSDLEEAAAAAAADVAGKYGNPSRQAARAVLETVVKEACARHVDRLVQSVSMSGNRQLRTNVALALSILSTSTGGDQESKAWRSFVSGGALTAVLRMLRSPTGRPAAVSFLRTVSALLERLPAPPDILLLPGEDEEEGRAAGEAREEGRRLPTTGGHPSSGEGDTVVLVKDPLACSGREMGNRGGQAEAEGIKMACPPREVILRASPFLLRFIVDTPAGRLPLLNGRYRAWEEVMAHMGAPHTFASSSASYSTMFLIEMFILASTFKIEAQTNGYAHELRRRLGPLSTVPSVKRTSTTAAPASAPAPAPAQAAPTAAVSSEQSAAPPSNNNNDDTGRGGTSQTTTTTTTALAAANDAGQPPPPPPPVGELRPLAHTQQQASEKSTHLVVHRTSSGVHDVDNPVDGGTGTASGADGRTTSGGGICEGSGRSSSSSSSSSSGNSVNSRKDRREAESVVVAMLEASVRCRHGWLCGEVFREASAMMGNGDGEGLPPPARELTALLALLQEFLKLVRVSDFRKEEEEDE